MTYEYEQYLAHHGVKGQSWGKRRYQNADGSYTEEGRAHYGIGQKRSEADSWRKDESKSLSDQELDRRNTRMQKEAQYRNNIDNRHPARREAISTGKKVLIGSAAAAAGGLMAANYKKLFQKLGEKTAGAAKKLGSKAAGSAAASSAKGAVKGAAKKVSSAVKNTASKGKNFLVKHRRIVSIGAGVAATKGAEYWKKRNDSAGKSNRASDFAYKHRRAIGIGTALVTNKLLKKWGKR